MEFPQIFKIIRGIYTGFQVKSVNLEKHYYLCIASKSTFKNNSTSNWHDLYTGFRNLKFKTFSRPCWAKFKNILSPYSATIRRKFKTKSWRLILIKAKMQTNRIKPFEVTETQYWLKSRYQEYQDLIQFWLGLQQTFFCSV